MKSVKSFLLASAILLSFAGNLESQSTTGYYLPRETRYDKNVPSPSDYFGYNVGEWHVSHDQLISYFKELSLKSPRVRYITFGKTHEARPMTLAIISSEDNIRNIEKIREKHLQICDPSVSQSVDLTNQPVVVWLSHSIHGNEVSGATSSMLTAYHFAAAAGKETEDLLASTVILIDPSTNPDGLQRFSTWANSHKSYQVNTDPLSREHIEAWPGGRSNHYWFDLNRDWLPVEQPESESRIKMLLEWKPNVLVDLHEMGSNSTFHFSPGEPERVNPLIPGENQDLTRKLAEGYAKAFDAIGSFYFSAEQFDDYYIGRGPTFMDMNGGVALLFEQASSRGFAQTTENGLLTFPFAIKNQLTGALSSVSTAYNLRNEFLKYQRNYYATVISESKKNLRKAYIFGSEKDRTTTFRMAQFLNTHGIQSFLLKKDIRAGKNSFRAANAYVVPLEQPQYRLIESIFEVRTTFRDSIFYDVSAWNIPMAYNLPFEALDARQFTADLKGDTYAGSQKPAGSISGSGNAYAWAIRWSDYNAPAALYKLLANNITVKVATSPVETLSGDFYERGTLFIPMGSVNSDVSLVEKTMAEITSGLGLNVSKLSTGDNKKIDLGSPTLVNIEKPKIVILTEEGVNGFSAGQLWHLFDTRYNIPVTLLPIKLLSTFNIYNYNILIIPDGNYQAIDDRLVEKIRNWAAAGNTVIALERASQWVSRKKLINIEFGPEQIENKASNYGNSLLYAASREIPGTIYEIVADLTHPLYFGYPYDHIPVYKDNNIVQTDKDLNPLNYPARYTSNPLLSGYSPHGFDKTLSSTPVCSVFPISQGRIIASYNNPVFRAYWRGSNRFIANAIFFGRAIRFSAGRE